MDQLVRAKKHLLSFEIQFISSKYFEGTKKLSADNFLYAKKSWRIEIYSEYAEKL